MLSRNSVPQIPSYDFHADSVLRYVRSDFSFTNPPFDFIFASFAHLSLLLLALQRAGGTAQETFDEGRPQAGCGERKPRAGQGELQIGPGGEEETHGAAQKEGCPQEKARCQENDEKDDRQKDRRWNQEENGEKDHEDDEGRRDEEAYHQKGTIQEFPIDCSFHALSIRRLLHTYSLVLSLSFAGSRQESENYEGQVSREEKGCDQESDEEGGGPVKLSRGAVFFILFLYLLFVTV